MVLGWLFRRFNEKSKVSFQLHSFCRSKPMKKLLIIAAVTLSGSSLAGDSSPAGGFESMWECGKYSANPALIVAYVFKKGGGGVYAVGAGEMQDAIYYVEGVNRRWDFGPMVGKTKSLRYSLLIQPDGTGLYVDFISGGAVKPSQTFECKQTTS